MTKKEKQAERSKRWYDENKEKAKATTKQWYADNKAKATAYNKKYRTDNKEKTSAYEKKYREANKEKAASYAKIYNKANKEKLLAQRNKYKKERFKNDPLFKMKCTLRDRTSSALRSKGYKKNSTTQKILGASYIIVKRHLHRQFTDGMSWINHGEWHIDHIIPLASATTEAELLKLCHYRNLQPLWAADNFSKGDKLNWVKEI